MALVASLAALLILATLAATLLETHTAQLRLATGQAALAQSRQAALAQLEAWLAYLALSAPAGAAGDVHCQTGVLDGACQFADLPQDVAAGTTTVRVLAAGETPPRQQEAVVSSAVNYRSVHYEITTRAAPVPGGPAVSLSQGVRVLYPALTP